MVKYLESGTGQMAPIDPSPKETYFVHISSIGAGQMVKYLESGTGQMAPIDPSPKEKTKGLLKIYLGVKTIHRHRGQVK